MACATVCSLLASTPASIARTFSKDIVVYRAIELTTGVPLVSTPVLSRARACNLAASSRKEPPLISTPCRAAEVKAETKLTGVEITSAQGQEISSTSMLS